VRAPLITLFILAVLLAIHATPGADYALAYHPGHAWSLVSSHFTHFTTQHLAWNALAFGLVGGLLESRSRSTLVVSLVLGLLAVSIGVLLDPQVIHYRGFSGLATSVFAALAGREAILAVRHEERARTFGIAVVFALFALKSGVESSTRVAVFAADPSFVLLPSAHVLGALAGVAAAWLHFFTPKVRFILATRPAALLPLLVVGLVLPSQSFAGWGASEECRDDARELEAWLDTLAAEGNAPNFEDLTRGAWKGSAMTERSDLPWFDAAGYHVSVVVTASATYCEHDHAEMAIATRDDLKTFLYERRHIQPSPQTGINIIGTSVPSDAPTDLVLVVAEDAAWSRVAEALDVAAEEGFSNAIFLFARPSSVKPPEAWAQFEATGGWTGAGTALLDPVCLPHVAGFEVSMGRGELDYLRTELPRSLRKCKCETDLDMVYSYAWKMVRSEITPASSATVSLATARALQLPADAAWADAARSVIGR
jgi:hypothetical protein